MAKPYSDKVVGGIEEPRALLVGPELSPNISFEENLDGVSSPSGAATQEQDTSTQFGDYVLKVEDNNTGSEEYADVTIETGAAIGGRKFLVMAYAKNAGSLGIFRGSTPGLTDSHEKQFNYASDWAPVLIHEFLTAPADSGTSFVYRIHPAQSAVSSQGAVLIDNLRVREVLDEFVLPMPERGNFGQSFEREMQARNRLLDGGIKSHLLGHRWHYEASYDQLSAADEQLRRTLMGTQKEIVFFPHLDAPLAYFCEWDDALESGWAFGMAGLGHAGNVTLRGTELLPALPLDVVEEYFEYNYDQNAGAYIEGGDEFIE
jgi:hypothetical protein